MSDVNFSQNGMTIVGEPDQELSRGKELCRQPQEKTGCLQDTAHGIQDHLQHSLWTQTCPDDIRDSLRHIRRELFDLRNTRRGELTLAAMILAV